MHVSMHPGDQVQVRFSGPLGRMAAGIRDRARWFLSRVLHLRISDPLLAGEHGSEGATASPPTARYRHQSRAVGIVEVLCHPVLLAVQAAAFVALAAVCACGLVLWAAWRILCRLVKPTLVLAGVTALLGIGALAGSAYSEYRHTAIRTAADLSDPYGTGALPALRTAPVAPSPLTSPPPSPAPSVDELFKTPPASVPAPLQR